MNVVRKSEAQALKMIPGSRVVSALAPVIERAVGDATSQRAELRAGLLARPAHTAPKFLYDPQGCALYDALCKLDEYYPTRTEQVIFERHRDAITAQLPSGAQWVDLGCADGLKSHTWLQGVAAQRYIGVDIARDWLDLALRGVGRKFPHIDCLGLVTDLTRPLALHDLIAQRPDAPVVLFYPGSSIGNFTRAEALAFLAALCGHLDAHGRLLIGIDLIKDRRRLLAAYDDALGVTAAFNRNVLRVANRLLNADFDPAGYDHVAVFDEAERRIEMRLRARHAHTVSIDGTPRLFLQDETILTEYSCKYHLDEFDALLARAGFGQRQVWTDAQSDFAVFVAGR